jgi:3-methyl-2-oxobutanoate hydroxymethyltransferase
MIGIRKRKPMGFPLFHRRNPFIMRKKLHFPISWHNNPSFAGTVKEDFAMPGRNTTRTMMQMKKDHTPVVCLTAYTARMARLMDEHVDLILVGDSVGMTVYGMDSTVPVTLDMMIAHGKAVVDATEKALVVVDMPFGSYQESPVQAFQNATRIMKETGCQAVKLEGGKEMAETVNFMTQRGIAVMGHIGLQPQSVNAVGGYRVFGQNDEDNKALEKLRNDAQSLERAGAFGIVIECTAEPLAAKLTEQIKIPTIGIGASAQCDGQILVVDDMLGLTANPPKFARAYADLTSICKDAFACYADDVRQRRFPAPENVYGAQKTSRPEPV